MEFSVAVVGMNILFYCLWGFFVVVVFSELYLFGSHWVVHIGEAIERGYFKAVEDDLVGEVDVLLPAGRGLAYLYGLESRRHELVNAIAILDDLFLERLVQQA